MVTSTRAEDQESLSRSRDRIREKQQQARTESGGAGVAGATKNKVTGVIKGLKDMDGIQIFFVGVAGLIDFVGFVLGLLTGSFISAVDWIVDIPLLIFFVFLAAILVLSNPSSIKTIVIGLLGPIGVGFAEISPFGILPFYLGWAVWLVSQINNDKKKKEEKKKAENKQADSSKQTEQNTAPSST